MSRALDALAIGVGATTGAVAATVGLIYAERAFMRRHSLRRVRPACI